MAVDNDTTLLRLAGSIARRAGRAVECILTRNGTVCDIGQIERLARALELFNKNLLGEVQMYVSEPGKKPELNKAVQKLRTAFRKKIDRLGEEKVEEDFISSNKLFPRIRHLILGHRLNNSQRWPLRKLVARTEREIIGNIGMGKKSLPFFIVALANEGLSLGMSKEEIEECFGPERVRTVIYLKDFNSEKDIRTGVEVVIEGSDGKLYRSVTCANGAHFALPPGECKILRPKLHSPRSADGYERIFLEMRLQYEAHTFYLVGQPK